jgi:phage tail protein X
MNNYIVKQGESITDVVLNSTGSLSNWDTVLEANGFTDWVPDLAAGQAVVIPDTVNIDANTKRQLATYPACNASVNDVLNKIGAVFSTMENNWILATTFWNDKAIWIDLKTWED